MQLRTLIALITVLGTLNVPTVAEASEVVKLARLVLTGKRVGAEPHREPSPTVPVEKAPTTAPVSEPGNVSAAEPQPTTSLTAGASGISTQNQTFLRLF